MATEPSDHAPKSPDQPDKPDQPKRSLVARAAGHGGGWLRRHPVGALQILLVILLAIIVSQNMEPTSIRVLFWNVLWLPKLVVILISMVIGAIIWSWISRRWLKRRRR